MSIPIISKRSNKMQESSIRKLVPFANEAKKKGKTVYHVNIGQPDIPAPKEALQIIKDFSTNMIAYSPSYGEAKYVSTLNKYYNKNNIKINEDNIIVTLGGSEAIILTLMAITDPGDEIIIPEPFYTNYNGFATMTGVNVVPVMTYAETGFHLPEKKEFEKKITKKTKAIMLCNPNNPTGAVYTKEELEMIIDLAIENDLYILSDEVYREFTYDNETALSILSFEKAKDHAILLDSISKRFSLCGARIGAIVTYRQDVLSLLRKFAQARLCAAYLEQMIAVGAHNVPENYFDIMISEYRSRRDVVMEELSKIPDVFYKIPKGAFYTIIKLPIENSDDFAKWLLTDFSDNNETVMVAPAGGFYATKNAGKNEIRIAFVLNTEKMRRAIKLLAIALKEYNKLD